MRRLSPWLIVALMLGACTRGTATSPPRATAPASATSPSPPSDVAPDDGVRIVAVDVFDTDRATVQRVLAAYGDELDDILRDDVTVDIDALTARIRAFGDFAYVEPALIGYFGDDGVTYYLTIDIVGRRDAAWRMPFAPAPAGTYEDPGGVLAAWDAFERATHELIQAGEIGPAQAGCPALHCLADHAHPTLVPLGRTLADRVPAHLPELGRILVDDHRVAYRAAAAYALAYAPDGATAVRLLVPALHDNSALVRNNAMRVLADIARLHPDIDIPIDPVLEALAYPATTDRNKAAAILHGLLSRPDGARLHTLVARRAGDTLLAMLRLRQPNNHDFAYMILTAISGQDLGARDYDAWAAWLLAQRR